MMQPIRLGFFELKSDPAKPDAFTSNMGSLSFYKENNKVGFKLPRGRVKDLRFEKR